MIRTITKALRCQKSRHKAGKLGWARAVRRFVEANPHHRAKLMLHVRDAEGSRAAQRAFAAQSRREKAEAQANSHWSHAIVEAGGVR